MSEKMKVESNTEMRHKFVVTINDMLGSSKKVEHLSMLFDLIKNLYQSDDTYAQETDLESYHLEIAQMKEFTCWLIATLLNGIDCNEMQLLCSGLHVTILQSLASRCPNSYREVIVEYIQIAVAGQNVLQTGTAFSLECFGKISPTILEYPKPIPLMLSKKWKLNHQLATIISVFGQLVDTIDLFVRDHLSNIWLFVCTCINHGDEHLRYLSLKSLANFWTVCGIPMELETMDYLVQSISTSISNRTFIDHVQTEKTEMEEDLLASLVHFLWNSAGLLPSFFICEVLKVCSSLFLSPEKFVKLSGVLQTELVLCTFALLDADLDSKFHVDGNVQQIISHCLFNELFTSEAGSVMLEKLVIGELKKQLMSNKRKLSDKDDTQSSQENTLMSPSWNQFTLAVTTAVTEWQRVHDVTAQMLRSVTKLIDVAERVAANMCKLTMPNSLNLFNETWLTSVIDALTNLLMVLTDIVKVRDVLKLVVVFVRTFAVLQVSCISSELWHSIVALTSLPWLASEINWIDLKLIEVKLWTQRTTLICWGQDDEAKSLCVATMCLAPADLAPQWRCQVIRIVINEWNLVVVMNLARFFPSLVQQLGFVAGQQLLKEVLMLMLQDAQTVLIISKYLRQLLCSFSKLSTFQAVCDADSGNGVPPLLSCSLCRQNCQIAVPRLTRIDPTILSLFLSLLSRGDSSLQQEIISALPVFAYHRELNPVMLRQFLRLLAQPHLVSELSRQVAVVASEMAKMQHDLDTTWVAGETVSFLDEWLHDALQASDTQGERVKAVLEVLHRLVKCDLTGIVEKTLLVLLRCLVYTFDGITTATADLVIGSLASTLGIPRKELLIQHCQVAIPALAGIILPGQLASTIYCVAKTFQWSGNYSKARSAYKDVIHAFVSSHIRYLIPSLVVRAYQLDCPNMLMEVSQSHCITLRDLLIDQCQYIVAHLVFSLTEKEQQLVLDFICRISDMKTNVLQRVTSQSQVNELILGLHDHRSAVLKYLGVMRHLETLPPEGTGASFSIASGGNCVEMTNINSSASDIADFLAPRLLGILGFLDSKLVVVVAGTSYYKEQRAALLSLSDLLVIMGPRHVSPVSRKVLSSLKTALQPDNEEFCDIGCLAWGNFLANLDDTTLESLIEEVVVVMKPMVHKRPQQLAPVLKRVLLETPSVKSLLGNLPLLTNHPSLAEINDAIQQRQYRVVGGTATELASALTSLLRGLTCESLDVRQHALNRLKLMLKSNPNALYSLTMDADRVHPVISDLFSSLLGQCRESGEEVQVDVAQCLGLLGAIDPSRLASQTKQKGELEKVYSNIECEDFIVDLINELARAFLAATDGSVQTCAAYAMQEILRLYNIKERGLSEAMSVGGAVWELLPYHVQELLRPLFTSKYTTTAGRRMSEVSISTVVYGSEAASTFQLWLSRWWTTLLSTIHGDRAYQIFSACKPIARRDISTAIFLLPTLLMCLLQETEEHQGPIQMELLAVMNHKEVEVSPEATFRKIASSGSAVQTQEYQHLAVQTVFSALDYLSRWSQKQRQLESASKKNRKNFTPSQELHQIMSFLEKIPSFVLARASFECCAFSRALLHLEAHINENPVRKKDCLTLLQRIYVSLDEPDGLIGVAAMRDEEPSLNEQVIQFEATGRLQDALGCYERLCVSQGSKEVYQGLLRCYLSLDQPHSVLNITQGLFLTRPELEPQLNEYRVEAAWRLGQWDQLESFLSSTRTGDGPGVGHPTSWGVGVGQILLAARLPDVYGSYTEPLHRLRIQQITPLSAATMEKGAYQRVYPNILRLQVLSELEEMLSTFLPTRQQLINSDLSCEISSSISQPGLRSSPNLTTLHGMVDMWKKRLKLTPTFWRCLEPVLSFRRSMLVLARDCTNGEDQNLSEALQVELQQSWLQSARIARKAGYLQQGEWALLGTGSGPDVFVERAKWHWVRGEHHQAVTTLRQGIEKFFCNTKPFKGDSGSEIQEDQMACARARLLLARYSEESAIHELKMLTQLYREFCDTNRKSEDGHFQLGMFYDRVLNNYEMTGFKSPDWLCHIISSFAKSLSYGCRHVYKSMPRMLQIWLEFGNLVSDLERYTNTTDASKMQIRDDFEQLRDKLPELREKIAQMNTIMAQIQTHLPHYLFLTALPQLISRICHSNNAVFTVLCKIIASVLSSYPQQAVWHMIAVSKSSYQMRVSRCAEIFEAARRNTRSLAKFIADTTKLADRFLELANKKTEKGISEVAMSSFLRSLPRLLSDSSFSQIILPLQHQMTVTLPSSLETISNHNPFPSAVVCICGIEERVEIMASLQAPKKFTLRGSDGKLYIMMCKPKDDLRKDCRLMDFNAFMNLCFLRDPESRKRDLRIRTYTVVPLNEECGLIEWIQNLMGLRQILMAMYKEAGVYMSGTELKQCMCKISDTVATKKEVFLHKLLPRHPAVFANWFLRTFPDPQAWYSARLAYCRTTAVMSMVGYILGLGDRHGENILFDSSSGDAVHVDFNCLFNKGETFDWPELVPFRLTHNMVAGMGPTGCDGIYRKASEVAMLVMRNEREALMSVLRPFIHDPLVEWVKQERGAAKLTKGGAGEGEIANVQAQIHVDDIQQRLTGILRSKSKKRSFAGARLSVAGQVNYLIEEATSVENLCQMYIGWAAYM